MTIKNIYFIEPKSPGAHIFSRTPLPRLGTILLATILKNRGYNTRVFIEDISEPDWNALEQADMIGISSITSTAPRAYQIAEKYRALGIPVVMGGTHPTFLYEEALGYADYVIRGEGEESIVELLEHLHSGAHLNDIRGLSYKDRDGRFVHNPDRELIHDLDASPIPDLGLVHNWCQTTVIPIATSRGCPFACKFCSVIPMFGRKYRFKSIDRVIKEIKEVEALKAHIFFVDDNFAADKARTKALLRRLKAEDIRIEWSAQVRTDVAKDAELVNLIADTGCFNLFIGFESINPQTLAIYNKGQKVEDVIRCVQTLRDASIKIHGMFVFGSDTDNIQTIRDTQRFAKRLYINSIQFMMLTPLPGTQVFEELQVEGRLIHKDWSKYDAHHVVFKPRLMSAFELHMETLKAMAKFYSWGTILRSLLRRDFFFCLVGLYGKRSAKKALASSKEYLSKLEKLLSNNDYVACSKQQT